MMISAAAIAAPPPFFVDIIYFQYSAMGPLPSFFTTVILSRHHQYAPHLRSPVPGSVLDIDLRRIHASTSSDADLQCTNCAVNGLR